MSSPADEVIRDLGRILDGLALDWYLFGAQAAFMRGARRMTADVDVTVLPGSLGTTVLVHSLADLFDLRVPDEDGFVAQTRVIPLVHRATTMPVDLVLGGPGLEEHFLSRSEALTMGGHPVRVPLAEDWCS